MNRGRSVNRGTKSCSAIPAEKLWKYLCCTAQRSLPTCARVPAELTTVESDSRMAVSVREAKGLRRVFRMVIAGGGRVSRGVRTVEVGHEVGEAFNAQS